MNSGETKIILDLVDSRRRLCIRLDVGDSVWVGVYPRRMRASDPPLASGIGLRKGSFREPDQFSLRYNDHGGVTLWISDASFPISDAEARRIEAAYLAHGLEIHRSARAADSGQIVEARP